MLPVIYDGTGQAQAERFTLKAGKLSLVYEAGLIRYVSAGNREILRGVYAAVRDQNWDTIPGVLRDVSVDAQADSFHVRFTSEHQQGELHFVWHGEIVGTADSTISFTFAGTAQSTLQTNRTGFCILHPMTLGGQACVIEHADGSIETGVFPDKVAPVPPYSNIRTIRHAVLPGVDAEVRMEGDLYELEDQRNWSDASYKTYCTLHQQPQPVTLVAGATINQSVTIRLLGDPADVPLVKQGNILTINPAQRLKIPFIGLGMASHDEPLTEREYERLAALYLGHFRHELYFTDDMEDRLYEAVEDANVLEIDLEVGAHFGENLRAELARLNKALEDLDHGDLYILVRRHGEGATNPETFKLVQEAFDDLQSVFLVAGTDDNFETLNVERWPAGLAERAWYTSTPQVHAFDNSTMIETFPAMASVAAFAREITGAAVMVSPITLKPRWDRAVVREMLAAGKLPGDVDVRQTSLFGAGWVVGVIGALARGGAESATFFETTGVYGVMESDYGTPFADQFPSHPGRVYPMWHVFADVGEFMEGRVLASDSSQPLVFNGLALREGSRYRVLVANHTAEPQAVTIIGLDGRWSLKALDETTAEAALSDPEGYRDSAGQVVEAEDGRLVIELRPYAIARLDKV